GRHPFERLQLVHNGKVVQEVKPTKTGGGFSARLARAVRITEPGWFAARIEGKARNEFDQVLFAHTSPCYVDFEGGRRFDVEPARALLKRIEDARADVAAKGRFSGPKARAKLLAVYDEATDDLRSRINKRGKPRLPTPQATPDAFLPSRAGGFEESDRCHRVGDVQAVSVAANRLCQGIMLQSVEA